MPEQSRAGFKGALNRARSCQNTALVTGKETQNLSGLGGQWVADGDDRNSSDLCPFQSVTVLDGMVAEGTSGYHEVFTFPHINGHKKMIR